MRCDEARRTVSLVADGEIAVQAVGTEDAGGPGDVVDVDRERDVERLGAHLASCDACTDFERHVLGLRTQLRVEPVDATPDVVDAVLRRLRALPTTPPPVVPRREPRRDRARARERLLWPVTALWAGRGAVSAAAAAGFLAGAAFVGVGHGPSTQAAADLPQRVTSLQNAVTAVAADIQVTEYGRPDRSGPRVFTGKLRYGGPEELELTLQESARSRQRAQGSGAPGDGDIQLSVTADHWLLDSVRGCMPTPGRAACPDGATRVVRSVTGRVPFSEAAPIPLELVAPVQSFSRATAPPSLGERTIAGREAMGVTVTAAQVARFVEQLSPAGDLRAVYPTDRVEMWLDRDDLVPLALVVYADDSPERERWATMQAYDDQPGDRILAFSATDVQINDVPPGDGAGGDGGGSSEAADQDGDADDDDLLAYDTGTGESDGSGSGTGTGSGGGEPVRQADRSRLVDEVRGSDQSNSDEGFEAGEAPSVPVPAVLPAGFTASRSGTSRSRGGPIVEVRSWTDGRAWLKVEATEDWTAEHLFGGLGPAVRTVDLGAGGRGYLSVDGHKVAIHTVGLDLVVSGSLPTDELVDLAGSLGVRGTDAPEDWRESTATTLTYAATSLPDLLTPDGLTGFGRPAVRIVPDATVTQVYAGPGDRGFVLTQSPSPDLPPPTDDALGVEVRGRPGRYTADQSLLEWSEGGSSLSLTSPTLSLAELLDITATLKTL